VYNLTLFANFKYLWFTILWKIYFAWFGYFFSFGYFSWFFS